MGASRHFYTVAIIASALAAMLSLGGCNSVASPTTGTSLALDYQRDHLSLNGVWLTLAEHSEAEAFRPEASGRLAGWQERTIPGSLMGAPATQGDNAKLNSIWARRNFRLTNAQARRDVALRHGGIRFGATTWINGLKVDDHATIGPNTVLIPRGILRAGDNEIVLKVTGWAGVPRGARGRPLVPVGASTQSWGSKLAAIFDDIRLEFYDRVYVKWALAIPDIRSDKVTFRVLLDAADKMPGRVRLAATMSQDGRVVGRAEQAFAPTTSPVEMPVVVKQVKLWTPEEPNLCRAELSLTTGDSESEVACDSVAFTFGMREFKVEDGRYRLNGKLHWFRGSDLVGEFNYGSPLKGKAKQYLVDEGRTMNLTAFRTHTIPPTTDWADVCDRYGTALLAELPVLYNYAEFKFTPEEYEVFHANALADAVGWITKLWNHPSVMMWVISNECIKDDAWESGPYWRYVKDLDPTRPAMRAGGQRGTPEVMDTHSCSNFHDDHEGRVVAESVERGRTRDPKRTLGDSEYMNAFSGLGPGYARWLGRADHPDGPLAYAECAAEHTEAFRRAGYDLLLPYQYMGWTATRNNLRPGWKPWRPDWPVPISAALHSSMSPVLASLDLFDRNFPLGEKVTTDTVLINETGQEVSATLELYLTPRDPLFIPDKDALAAGKLLSREKLTLQPYSVTRHKLTWQVPAEPGCYYLAAVTRWAGAKPVVSQRVVRPVPLPEAKLTGRKVAVIGGDDTIRGWLKAHELAAMDVGASGPIKADVVLVWDPAKVTDADRAQTAAILDYVKAGGRLVILHHGKEWAWKDLLDFQPERESSSRAFPVEGAKHRLLAGFDPEWLKRWNGADEPLADSTIAGEAVKGGTRLLWTHRPEKTCALSLPLGKGEVLLTTLHIQNRVDPSGARYDPAAGLILRNLLGR